MKKEESIPTDDEYCDEPRIGEETSSVKFSQFVNHLTGVSFDEIFNNFSSKDKRANEKSNME